MAVLALAAPFLAANAGAIGLAGAAASAGGALFQGFAQSSAANYSAEVARNNALIEQQRANQATAAGATQAQQASLKSAAQQAQIVGGLAAGGVDVNSGSAEDVRKSQRELGELDTATTEHNALLEAYGYRVAAAGDTAQAGLDTAAAAEAPIGAAIGATGDILSGASSVGFKWTGVPSGGSSLANSVVTS